MEFSKEPLLQSLLEGSEKDIHSAVSISLSSLVTSADLPQATVTAVRCGSTLLNLFCRVNWTGPPLSPSEETALNDLSLFEEQCIEPLSWDGESPYDLCLHPVLLALSHLLLEEAIKIITEKEVEDGREEFRSMFDLSRWRIRCLFIQQRLLSQRSGSLWKQLSQIMKQGLVPSLEGGQLTKSELCETNLEMGHIYLYYSDYQAAQECFERALTLVGIETELSGSLGKRTKFQEKDIAQLLLKVTPTSQYMKTELPQTIDKTSLPHDLLLGDDTLLEKIEFTDQPSSPELSSLQQAVVLGECLFNQKSSARQRLTSEEVEAYLRCVLSNPSNWSVQFQALFTRCLLEKTRRRTVERSMMQLESLLDSTRKPGESHRLSLFYCLPVPAKWTVERELALVLVSLGSTHSALEIYERLQMWEDVIACYQSIGRKGRAEEIVREQLEQKETPVMLCLLGDITEDPQWYTRAWELSNHRSARAQRSLGLFYLRREKYKESIDSLQLSLQVNSMQVGLWFSLGCAASKIGDIDLETKAFQRSVILDPEFAEAWNNLGAAYLKKKDKARAYRVYVETVKFGYGSWNIWENLLVVSTDVGAFDDAIRAYHRLLELRQKYTDVDVLRVLVTAVTDNIPDINERPASRLRKQLGELLGRICAQTTVGADVWRLYATFHFASDNLQDQEKGLIEMQKAQRTVRLEQGWDKEEGKLHRVAEFTLKYCEACRRVSGLRSSDQSKLSLSNLSSAKLVLQSVISKAKGFGLTEIASVKTIIEQLDNETKEILSAIENITVQ